MITPNLDAMAQHGVSFTHAFCPGATCISSRAAIFTGMYPHTTGVYSFNQWCHHATWVQDLANSGYHCVNLGKMHCAPHTADAGFHERQIVENKTTQAFERHNIPNDEWGKHLLLNGKNRPCNRRSEYEDWIDRHNAVEWEWDEDLHSDAFTGNMALGWLKTWNSDKPLFLEVGFPGPHEPYDPPKRFLDLYAAEDIPGPAYREGELADNPPQHQAHVDHFRYNKEQDAQIDLTNATDDEIREMRRHYCANVTLIDEKVGEIVSALEEKGMLENTVIIFTSDHGDSLGDHRVPYKWLMYDSITRVPFIVADYRREAQNKKTDDLVSLMDLGPTILNLADTPPPPYLEGRSLSAHLTDSDLARGRDYVFCEDNYLVMIRSRTHKLVYYIGQSYGELYDLQADPDELQNVWDDSAYADVKTELHLSLLDWFAASNYQNGGYKEGRRKYEPRWPGPTFGDKLIGRP